MWSPPFLVLPLIAYNWAAFVAVGFAWSARAVRLALPSGAVLQMTFGDALVAAALVLLLLGALWSNRNGRVPVRALVISALVTIIYVIEFLIVPAAGTALFLVCAAASLIETVNGFAISLQTADRA
jgi:hypothetical protein